MNELWAFPLLDTCWVYLASPRPVRLVVNLVGNCASDQSKGHWTNRGCHHTGWRYVCVSLFLIGQLFITKWSWCVEECLYEPKFISDRGILEFLSGISRPELPPAPRPSLHPSILLSPTPLTHSLSHPLLPSSHPFLHDSPSHSPSLHSFIYTHSSLSHSLTLLYSYTLRHSYFHPHTPFSSISDLYIIHSLIIPIHYLYLYPYDFLIFL